MLILRRHVVMSHCEYSVYALFSTMCANFVSFVWHYLRVTNSLCVELDCFVSKWNVSSVRIPLIILLWYFYKGNLPSKLVTFMMSDSIFISYSFLILLIHIAYSNMCLWLWSRVTNFGLKWLKLMSHYSQFISSTISKVFLLNKLQLTIFLVLFTFLVLQIADQLVNRVHTLHEKSIIHRDIKPVSQIALFYYILFWLISSQFAVHIYWSWISSVIDYDMPNASSF